MRLTRRRLGTIIALLGVGSVIVLGRPSTVLPALRSLIQWEWFPVVLLGLYVLRPLLAWPVMVLSALVGFRYGVLLGVPLALGGAAFTSVLPYAAGRYTTLEGPVLGHFSFGSRAYFDRIGDLRGVIAARLAPLPAEPVSIGAGTGGVSVGAFVLGTVIGELPWTIAAVTIGHSMTVFTTGDVDPQWWLVALAGLTSVTLLARPAYRTYRNRVD